MTKDGVIQLIEDGSKLPCSHSVSEIIKALPLAVLPKKIQVMRQFITDLSLLAETIGVEIEVYSETPNWNDYEFELTGIEEDKLDELLKACRKTLSSDSPENFDNDDGKYEFSVWKAYTRGHQHWFVQFKLFEDYEILETTTS